jgi:hypothetical protein
MEWKFDVFGVATKRKKHLVYLTKKKIEEKNKNKKNKNKQNKHYLLRGRPNSKQLVFGLKEF